MVRRAASYLSLFLATLVAAGVFSSAETSEIRVDDLRCEYQASPVAIEHAAPRLSWTLTSPVRGEKQSAYRVVVSRSTKAIRKSEGDLWDSGKVESSQSINIPYAGKPIASGQICYWKVTAWDKEGQQSNWSSVHRWRMGLLDAADWEANWISNGKPLPEEDADFYRDDPAPLFRKEFELTGRIKSAWLNISALGYVQARLNGREIGDHRLDPIWTLPNKRVFYNTYDVTRHLQEGSNCFGVTLGGGWYNPVPLSMWGRVNLRDRIPVGRPQFIAQMVVEYATGKRELIVSDDSWKVTEGPVVRNSIYLGEVVDARKAIDGWDQPGLDDRAWNPAKIVAAPEGVLQSQAAPPIRVTKTLHPTRITEPSRGVYLVDMGQNFGGSARFEFDVPAGTEITIRYGELLYEDGTLNPMTSVCGQIKRKQAPADGSPAVAWQGDTYTARGGGKEVYTPSLTFHAFRYIELTGLPTQPSPRDILGLRMQSDVRPIGSSSSFICSNEQFNKIQDMCDWTFRSNLFGVQSDCPHRERFGYGGDLVTTADAFMLNYDMARFYAKVARDWQDSALPDGMLTDTAPSVGIQYCGVGWAMAHPLLQERLYQYYGDKQIIEEQYATSRKWLGLVQAQYPGGIVQLGLHDHEALQKEKSPPMVTPLYCDSIRILARLAKVLGKDDEAEEYRRLAESVRKAYVEEFYDAETGKVASGIQGAQAFALHLDMLPKKERPKALKVLLSEIEEEHDGHLTTGIFGTKFVLDALSRAGHAELVNRIVSRREFPGWGYMLDNGATTLWEHWRFSDGKYSHNHPMFGSVSQWFYNWVGGIQPARDAVAFDKFTFQPQFLEHIDWAKCSHRSIRGPVACHWHRSAGSIGLELTVPIGSDATLVLPRGRLVEETDATVAIAMPIDEQSATQARYKLVSGKYKLRYTPSE